MKSPLFAQAMNNNIKTENTAIFGETKTSQIMNDGLRDVMCDNYRRLLQAAYRRRPVSGF